MTTACERPLSKQTAPAPVAALRVGGVRTLRDLEPRYRALIEHGLDASMLICPRDGRVLIANRACEVLFGYSEAELSAYGCAALVAPSDPRVEGALDALHRSGASRDELHLKTKDGRLLDAEVSSTLFRAEDGSKWASVLIRDITERKRLEAERMAFAAKADQEVRWLSAIFDSMPVAVIVREANGHIRFNTKAEVLLGPELSSERGVEQFAHRLRLADGSPAAMDALPSARVLHGAEAVLCEEFLFEQADATRIPVLVSAAALRDAEQRVIGDIGIYQDISRWAETEEALRASERLLSATFQILPVGVWIADPTGRLIRSNDAAQRIWGGARWVGPEGFGAYQGWWSDSGEPLEPEEWGIARALFHGETSIGELIRIRCFDGSFKTIINSAIPLYNTQGRFVGAVAVNEDVTALKETEVALTQAVEWREHVLGVVAHDLRGPLHAILLQLHLLLRIGERRTDQNDSLHGMVHQVKKMQRLTRDLLDVAGLETGQLPVRRSPVDPAAIAKRLVHECRSMATDAGLDLLLGDVAELPNVDADTVRLLQALENAVTNAVKFTPRGGRILVDAKLLDGEVVFSVADSGVGMTPETLCRVFDRMWQASPDRRGIGLGLNIAKGIVDAHQGRIWAESTLGAGTTVFVALPALGAEPSYAGPPPPARDGV